MGVKELVAGTVLSVVIGGTAYTVNQADVVNNFASDTGMTQQQAEQYVEQVNEDDLVPYTELGASHIDEGNQAIEASKEIDCVSYEYEWQTPTLSCNQGKAQLYKLGTDEVSLGNAYIKLGSDDATKVDISTTVTRIDDLNADYDYEIVARLLDAATIEDSKNSNSYNKATLKAALEGND